MIWDTLCMDEWHYVLVVSEDEAKEVYVNGERVDGS